MISKKRDVTIGLVKNMTYHRISKKCDITIGLVKNVT